MTDQLGDRLRAMNPEPLGEPTGEELAAVFSVIDARRSTMKVDAAHDTPEIQANRPWRFRPVMAFAGMAILLIAVLGTSTLLLGGSDTPQAESPTATTVAPTATSPVAPAEDSASSPDVPWVRPGEIRIGSTVITAESVTVADDVVTLVYEITSLAPTGAAMDEELDRLSAPVLPEEWVLETTNGSFVKGSWAMGRTVRFDVDGVTSIDDITSVKLVAWRSVVPVAYDIIVDAEDPTPVLLPDGSAIEPSWSRTDERWVLVSFDITSPVDSPLVVSCGGIRGLGARCFDPVPDSGWIHRETDAELVIGADAGTSINEIPLRYQRPMWTRHEGSETLNLTATAGSSSNAPDFPSGFVAVDENEAISVTAITRYDDQLLVSVVSATRRGSDPGSFDPLMGGRWVLESAYGPTLESAGMVYNDRIPGAFSVIFPMDSNTAIEPTMLRLVERWVPVEATGVTEAGLGTSVVSELEGSAAIVDLGGGVQVSIERFHVEGVGGYGVWASIGDPSLPVIADVTRPVVGSDGSVAVTTESWSDPIRNFGVTNTGRLFWFWVTEPTSGEDPDDLLSQGTHHLELVVEAEIPDPQPIDVVIDLTDITVR